MKGRASGTLSLKELEPLFHLPAKAAATELGMGLTTFKKLCRQAGLSIWPYRLLKNGRSHFLKDADGTQAGTARHISSQQEQQHSAERSQGGSASPSRWHEGRPGNPSSSCDSSAGLPCSSAKFAAAPAKAPQHVPSAEGPRPAGTTPTTVADLAAALAFVRSNARFWQPQGADACGFQGQPPLLPLADACQPALLPLGEELAPPQPVRPKPIRLNGLPSWQGGSRSNTVSEVQQPATMDQTHHGGVRQAWGAPSGPQRLAAAAEMALKRLLALSAPPHDSSPAQQQHWEQQQEQQHSVQAQPQHCEQQQVQQQVQQHSVQAQPQHWEQHREEQHSVQGRGAGMGGGAAQLAHMLSQQGTRQQGSMPLAGSIPNTCTYQQEQWAHATAGSGFGGPSLAHAPHWQVCGSKCGTDGMGEAAPGGWGVDVSSQQRGGLLEAASHSTVRKAVLKSLVAGSLAMASSASARHHY